MCSHLICLQLVYACSIQCAPCLVRCIVSWCWLYLHRCLLAARRCLVLPWGRPSGDHRQLLLHRVHKYVLLHVQHCLLPLVVGANAVESDGHEEEPGGHTSEKEENSCAIQAVVRVERCEGIRLVWMQACEGHLQDLSVVRRIRHF